MDEGFQRALPTGIVILLLLVIFLAGCEKENRIDRPNLIVIILDATRPDHLGCYGYNGPTSPIIDELAAGGIRFENAITQAPWTKASFTSMLTSLNCFEHGVTGWTSVLPDTFITLPEALARAGYSTGCVINMVGMEARFGILQGFAHQSVYGKYDRDATATTNDAISLLETLPQPFFLFIHYFDTHHPYTPPDQFIRITGGDTTLIKRRGVSEEKLSQSEKIQSDIMLYDACIRYVDTEIGRIVNTLKQLGIYETTLLVITADHGEAFGEHGTTGHGRTLYDEELKVPLVFHLPARFSSPTVVSEQVRLIDLPPTLLQLAHIPIPSSWEGVSLISNQGQLKSATGGRRNPIPTNIAITETSMRPGVLPLKSARTNAWKVIIEPATGLVEIYNLKTDPRETRNILAEMPPQADSLINLLDKIPGSRFAGWRIAFLDTSSGCSFHAQIEAQGNAEIIRLKKHAYRGHLVARQQTKATLTIESQPAGINLVSFDTAPEGNSIAFRFDVKGCSLTRVYVGRRGKQPTGTTFSLNPSESNGLPEEFTNWRKAHRPGVFLWWLPGKHEAREAKRQQLSPQERKRLKALGYIQ